MDDIFYERFKVDYANAKSKKDAIYSGKKYRITILSDILVRLEYSEEGLFEDRPTELARFRNFDLTRVDVEEEGNILTLKTKYFELRYNKESDFLGRKVAPDENLLVKLNDTDKVWYLNHAEARNFKSNTISLDDMKSRPDLEKGLYSTDGFVSIDDSDSLIFNEDGTVGKRADKRTDIYLFMYKKDFGYCLKDYYKLTGYPPLIPRFAFGVWWDKNEKYDAASLELLISKFKKTEVPISTIVLNEWSEDETNFPEADKIIPLLKENKIHLSLPLNLETVKFKDEEEPREFNVFDKNFLIKYFNEIIEPLDKLGVDFYKINYKAQDLYTLRMLNYYFYKYQDTPERRGMILSRNGLIDSHLYPISDSGETYVNWKTLAFLPEYNSTSSNIGVSYWSHSIGGFKEGIEDSELYTRFIQLGTYSPIFRLASQGGHYYKREPWMWDVKTRKIVRDYTKIRHRLIPYLYSESYKYSKTGLPLLQPLYYRYPEIYDEPVYKNEYYFGTELFVCPITSQKEPTFDRSIVNLFLPNGMWYDFKTGKKFPGGKRYVSFYEDDGYPVFAKQGAIITLNNDPEELNSTDNPKSLEIIIFPGANNTYKLYEDDGCSNQNKLGKYLITSIDYNYLPNNFTVIIRPIEGDLTVIPETRSYKIRFRNTRHADDVIIYLGRESIKASNYYLDETDFVVEINDAPINEQLSINCKGKDIEIDAIRVINEDIDRIISDSAIPTRLKNEISKILFDSEVDIKEKRIAIRKLWKQGLNERFVKMFLKLLEYVSDI